MLHAQTSMRSYISLAIRSSCCSVAANQISGLTSRVLWQSYVVRTTLTVSLALEAARQLSSVTLTLRTIHGQRNVEAIRQSVQTTRTSPRPDFIPQ